MKRGDPLGFINIHSVAKYQKTRRGDSFETLKIFRQKFRTVPKKIERVFGLFRFFRLCKKGKKWKGGPFALSFYWPDLAWVVLSVSVKSGTYRTYRGFHFSLITLNDHCASKFTINTLLCLTRIRFVLVLRKIHFTLDDKIHFCGICSVMTRWALWSDEKKTSHCNSRAFFLKGKGAD